MRNIYRLSCFALMLGLLAACGRTAADSQPTRLPIGEEQWTPSPSQAPTIPTKTSIPTITSTVTNTLSPMPSLTPTPTVPLAQRGPWLFLRSEESLWALNPDGTGLTQITNYYNDPGYQGWLNLEIAPHGGRLAFFYPAMQPDYMVASPPELMLVALPSAALRGLTPLHSGVSLPGPEPGSEPGPDPNGDVYAAVNNRYGDMSGNPVWSPDGSMLAFIGAQDGPSADLYVYSTHTDKLTRLTDGPTQALDPSWSPDGRYIISAGASDMNFGVGGSNGPVIDIVWAVQPDGSDLRTVQAQPDGYAYRLGWVNNQAYIEYHSAWGCGDYGLTFVDFLTPHQYTFLAGAFNSAALDPVTGTVMVMVPEPPGGLDCGSSPEPGWYLISVYGTHPPQSIALEVAADPFTADKVLGWSPQAKLFFANIGDALYVVDLRGKVTLIAVPGDSYYVVPTISPNGRDWAIPAHERGLWIMSLTRPASQVFTGYVYDVLWTPDGTAILFVSEGLLYRAAAPDYQPVALAEVPDGEIEWVMP